MKLKVLLINLPYLVRNIDVNMPKVRSFLGFPYGLLSVATYCKNLADIKIIDCEATEYYQEAIQFHLENYCPDIVGFSITFDSSYPHLGPLVQKVKNYDPGILIILGGAAASLNYMEILEDQKDITAVCFGEGEIAFRSLLLFQNFHHPSWATLSYPLPQLDFVSDPDDLIDIDYSLVNPENYEMQEAFSPHATNNKKQFFIMTSRGCSYSCTFCNNHQLHGKKVRQASVDKIIAHVRHLVDTYGMEVLTFYDDQLLFNPERAKELFRRLIPFNLRIECPNGLSVKFIDDEMAGLMAAAGMDTAYLAIESGSEYVLNRLIHKPLSLDMVKPAVDALRKYGIFVHGFFVFGMPGETDRHRQESLEFMREIDLDWYGLNMATPVRGSKLYENCVKNGWIEKQKIGETVDKKYIIHAGDDPEYIVKQVEAMNIELNFHCNRAMSLCDYETAARCFRQVIQRYGDHKWARYYLDICEKKLIGA